MSGVSGPSGDCLVFLDQGWVGSIWVTGFLFFVCVGGWGSGGPRMIFIETK